MVTGVQGFVTCRTGITVTLYMKSWEMQRRRRRKSFEMGISQFINLRQHRTIAEASAVESPIRQETIGFPAHFFARAHNFKPGRACRPEADS